MQQGHPFLARFAFLSAVGISLSAVNACSKGNATPGAESPEDMLLANDEAAAEAGGDSPTSEVTPESSPYDDAQHEPDDSLAEQDNREPSPRADPDRDSKGRRKVRAPQKNRGPSLNQPPAKPKPGSMPPFSPKT